MDSSSANDPGMSGMLCPMAHVFDNYFSAFDEPNTWRDEVRKMFIEYKKMRNLKQVFTFQREIGITPDETVEQLIDETSEIVESKIIPLVMDVDESMTDVSPVKGGENG